MKHLWSARKYREGDERQILELFNFIFKGSRSLGHWYWKFRDNPAGLAPIYVAEDDGKIVGQYALVPVTMKVRTELIQAAQNVDDMTHPNYTGQGMFQTLETKALSEATKEGIFIVYGFPNKAARSGHIKCGWFDICVIPKMVRLLDLAPILRRRIGNKFLFKVARILANPARQIMFRPKRVPHQADVGVTRVASFDGRTDSFWQKVSDDFNILVVRDAKYLNWRYADHPEGGYIIYLAENNNIILGFIVLKIVGDDVKTGHIVDILTMPGQRSAARCLVSKAVDHFRREKVSIACCYILDDRYYEILKESGFRPRPSELVLGARINSPGIPRVFLSDTKNWHITFGDSDGI